MEIMGRFKKLAMFTVLMTAIIVIALQMKMIGIHIKKNDFIHRTDEHELGRRLLITKDKGMLAPKILSTQTPGPKRTGHSLVNSNLKSSNGVQGYPKDTEHVINKTSDLDRNDKRNDDFKEEVRHIAFLKVHKAGSSTMQNILYRFGVARNLTFVLSKTSHYISKQKNNYNSIVDLPENRKKFDILCNHVVFNYKKIRKYLYDDAEYFAIIRDPLELVISAAYYYRYTWPTQYLVNINSTTFIHDLLHYPEQVEPEELATSRTYNYMTRDFGFELHSINYAQNVSRSKYETFITDMDKIFKVVLIMERFDESLVLLKRRFHWSLEDILYVKNNAYDGKISKTSSKSLSASDLEAFHKNFWMDIRLHEHFTKRFSKQIENEIDFQDEVRCFKNILKEVQSFCAIRKDKRRGGLVIHETGWNERIYVTSSDCNLMLMDELPFHTMLHKRHASMLNDNM